MKKISLALSLICGSLSLSAQNTFPGSGNVGIGTVSPAYPLHIKKTSSAPAISVGGGYAGSPRLQIYGLEDDQAAWMGLGVDMAGGPYEHSVYFPTGPNGTMGRFSIGDFNGTVYNPRLWLYANGRMGVNTYTPQSILHVTSSGSSINAINQYNGDLIIEAKPGSRSSTTGASLEFVVPANADGTNPWGQGRILTVAGNELSGHATGKMVLGTRRLFDKLTGTGNTWNYGDDIVIDGVGNVGIGTKSPQALLDAGRLLNSGELGSVLARLPEGNSAGAGTYLGVKGHGTTIGSDGRGKSFSIEHGFYGQTNSAINFYRGGAVTGGGISFSTNNNTEMMWILDNGNVGIGTAYPIEKLAVNGTIRSKEVLVENANWPDYVFDPTYNLPSLEKVETYINENHHLPEVPSAQEITDKGLSLGEMNKLLMKKVEELTLYLIESNKMHKKQQQEINDIKDRMVQSNSKH